MKKAHQWARNQRNSVKNVETVRVSFMDFGNVTMVSLVIENSQIQKASRSAEMYEL